MATAETMFTLQYASLNGPWPIQNPRQVRPTNIFHQLFMKYMKMESDELATESDKEVPWKNVSSLLLTGLDSFAIVIHARVYNGTQSIQHFI